MTIHHGLACALLCCACAAHAAGGDSSTAASTDPLLQSAQAAIARKDWDGAQAILLKALGGNASNADYHNLYAYSVRKSAHPNMDTVFSHYNDALRLDPKHRGAHEYIGEAYLQVGNLGKAREHLEALNKLCFFGCEEYTDLKAAIAAYQASHPQ